MLLVSRLLQILQANLNHFLNQIDLANTEQIIQQTPLDIRINKAIDLLIIVNNKRRVENRFQRKFRQQKKLNDFLKQN